MFKITTLTYNFRYDKVFRLYFLVAATTHKTPTVRPLAPYHENYSS